MGQQDGLLLVIPCLAAATDKGTTQRVAASQQADRREPSHKEKSGLKRSLVKVRRALAINLLQTLIKETLFYRLHSRFSSHTRNSNNS